MALGVELTADPERAGGWLLTVDGVAQSYVDTVDPTHLEFDYVALLAALLDLIAPAGEPLRVLHLGTGAATLARYLAHTRPGSTQLLVDADPEVLAAVAAALPVPAGCTVRLDDAGAAVQALTPGSFDVVVCDVFAGDRVPAGLMTDHALAEAAALLVDGGTWLGNVGDAAPWSFARAALAGLGAVLPERVVAAEPAVLGGRRFGNLVLAASTCPLPADDLARRAAGLPFRAGVLGGADLIRWVGEAGPSTSRNLVLPRASPSWGR